MIRPRAGRVLHEAVAWALVVVGIAALVLPGPGLLMMFAGLTMLARRYAWAARRVGPLRRLALRGAADSVATWPRIVSSVTLSLACIGCGILWAWGPPSPSWWPVDDELWLPGGVAIAVTQVAAGLIGLGLIVYSWRRFRGRPASLTSGPLSYEQADAEDAAA